MNGNVCFVAFLKLESGQILVTAKGIYEVFYTGNCNVLGLSEE